jgi:DNA-directed RNA polymerase subunit RPC12/RpoP
MPKVESLKCPNCGAAVRGTGEVTCPYCGSALAVSEPDRAHLKRLKVNFGTRGHTLPPGRKVHFKDLPGLAVDTRTTDIPFQPKVTYDKLPGGQPGPALRSEAQDILAAVERTQRAVNEENLELYATTVHPENKAFYERARRGAADQFITSDMKRYTLAVDFTALTAEDAAADVAFEAFIFLPSGRVNHVEATFAYTLKKYAGEWRISASYVKGAKLGMPKALWFALILPLAGLLIGVIAAIAAALHSCQPEAEETTPTNITVETSEHATVTGEGGTAARDDEGYYVAKTGIPLFKQPDLNAGFTSVITPGTKFKVTRQRGGWYMITSEDGARGWVPEAIIQANLGEDYYLE